MPRQQYGADKKQASVPEAPPLPGSNPDVELVRKTLSNTKQTLKQSEICAYAAVVVLDVSVAQAWSVLGDFTNVAWIADDDDGPQPPAKALPSPFGLLRVYFQDGNKSIDRLVSRAGGPTDRCITIATVVDQGAPQVSEFMCFAVEAFHGPDSANKSIARVWGTRPKVPGMPAALLCEVLGGMVKGGVEREVKRGQTGQKGP